MAASLRLIQVRKELSSFVFYTGTRCIRNDAHGRKMAIINPQDIKCRCWTTQLMAEQSTTNAASKTFETLDLGSKLQRSGSLSTRVGGMPKQKRQVKNMNMRPPAGYVLNCSHPPDPSCAKCCQALRVALKRGRRCSVHVPSFGHLRNKRRCSLVMEQSHCNAMRSWAQASHGFWWLEIFVKGSTRRCIHHRPAYPLDQRISSFVFYTGTRPIRNDAHGGKNGNHESSEHWLHNWWQSKVPRMPHQKLSRPLIWGPNCSVQGPSQRELGGCQSRRGK